MGTCTGLEPEKGETPSLTRMPRYLVLRTKTKKVVFQFPLYMENWKNQNDFLSDAGDVEGRQTTPSSGSTEPETVTVERPESGTVEEGEI